MAVAMAEIALDQRLDALQRANEVRERRSALKVELRAGEILLPEVLLSDEWWVQTWRLYELLLATPLIGKVKAKRILSVCKLSRSTRLLGLTPKGKAAVLEAIGELYPAVPLGSWRES